MNNARLDKLLLDAKVLERDEEFWKQFPERVMIQIRDRDRRGRREITPAIRSGRPSGNRPWWAPARLPVRVWGTAVAVLTGVAILAGVFWRAPRAGSSSQQFAQAQKYFSEIQALFPNQVRAVVFDPNGPRLVLAESADVPSSQPLYLKICHGKGCQRFVTFSGQQIQVDGQWCDVLVDRTGKIIVAGDGFFWVSGKDARRTGGYLIEAQPLGTAS